jgi:protein-S-isoprenylcysteine O-methyltransferase Ste14
MIVIIIQLAGAAAFVLATVVLGVLLRREPSRDAARRLSRISHAFYWAGLFLPGGIGVLTPGLRSFDRVTGLPPTPVNAATLLVAGALVVPGVYYTGASHRALRRAGSGASAFWLTARVVGSDVYATVRNPMSLGWYLAATGLYLAVGSTYLLLLNLLVVVPAHVFNLWFFEEHELLARFGEAYRSYRREVPFLLPRPVHG